MSVVLRDKLPRSGIIIDNGVLGRVGEYGGGVSLQPVGEQRGGQRGERAGHGGGARARAARAHEHARPHRLPHRLRPRRVHARLQVVVWKVPPQYCLSFSLPFSAYTHTFVIQATQILLHKLSQNSNCH